MWRQIDTAPKDGTHILVLLNDDDTPLAARWLLGRWDNGATRDTAGPGWHLVWDGRRIHEQDGPQYWMPYPPAPDETK